MQNWAGIQVPVVWCYDIVVDSVIRVFKYFLSMFSSLRTWAEKEGAGAGWGHVWYLRLKIWMVERSLGLKFVRKHGIEISDYWILLQKGNKWNRKARRGFRTKFANCAPFQLGPVGQKKGQSLLISIPSPTKITEDFLWSVSVIRVACFFSVCSLGPLSTFLHSALWPGRLMNKDHISGYLGLPASV